MGTRNDLLIQARNCGNWVERKNRYELDIAMMTLLTDYPDNETVSIAPDSVALENMRDAREAALSALCPIAESALPSAVTEEWDRAVMQATQAGPTQAMKPETLWLSENRQYERRVLPSGSVEWLAHRFNSRPPLFGETQRIEGHRYDYEGHPTAPTAVSLLVVRDIAMRLGNAALAMEITNIVGAEEIAVDVHPLTTNSRADVRLVAVQWVVEADKIANDIVRANPGFGQNKKVLASKVYEEMKMRFASGDKSVTKRGGRKLPDVGSVERDGLPNYGRYG